MTNRPDIWKRLQEYEISPPREIWAYLLELIHAVDRRGGPEIKTELEGLGQHEIQPPSFLRRAIEKSIAAESASTLRPANPSALRSANAAARPGKRSLSFYMYRSVAACLVLVIAGITLYKLRTPGNISPGRDKKAMAAAPIRPAAPVAQPDSLSEKEDSADLALATATDSNALVREEKGSLTLSFSVEGRHLTLVDNDLLTTFASFTYTRLPEYISRSNERSVKVHVDQYTNIYVSKNILDMMKEMYEVKSNGKPTRKARKSRDRLAGWKKADVKRFDLSSSFNPLDPIDLGGFIFK